MASVVISGDTSGAITISAPAVSGTNTLTLPAVTDTLTGIAATQTLTNKTLTSPTIATPTMTGQATIPTINLTGGQITFPATQSASSDANTLDDYEEGTWTPTVRTDTTQPSSVGYTGQYGIYTKVGNRVFVEANLGWSSVTGGTGSIAIGGLPFSPSGYATNDSRAFSYLAGYGGLTFTGQLMLIVQDSSTTALVYYNNSGSIASLSLSNATSGTFRMIFNYKTA